MTQTFREEVGQRKAQRFAFVRRAHLLIDGIAEPVPARLNNLSASGAYLRAERLPPIGSTCLCRFVVGGEEFVVRCRFKWIDHQWSPGQDIGPGAGVAFMGMDAHQRHLLTTALGLTPPPVITNTRN